MKLETQQSAGVSWPISTPAEALVLEMHIVIKGWLILTIFYLQSGAIAHPKSNKITHKCHMYILPIS